MDFADVYNFMLNTPCEYSNNFELFFKNVRVVKFCIDAGSHTVKNFCYNSNIIYDPDLVKKFNHYFLCQIGGSLGVLENLAPSRYYTHLCGYSITKQLVVQLALNNQPFQSYSTQISDALVNGTWQAQFLQNSRIYVGCKQNSLMDFAVSPNFFKGFYTHIDNLLKANPQNALLKEQLLAAQNLHDLMTTLSKLQTKNNLEHAQIITKISDHAAESWQGPLPILQQELTKLF